MSSARRQKTVMHGVPDHAAKIDGCDGARRPGALPARLPGCDEGRQVKSLGDPPGDETEQALVPAIGAEPDEGASRFERVLGSHEGFAKHARLAVIVASEQLGAEAGGPDPAAGIDARTKDEAERVTGGC